MERRYYEAYDDRYVQVHGAGLEWFSREPSFIVEEVIRRFGISRRADILEIGCGEGRDAWNLLRQGYQLTATDISPEAIRFCRERDGENARHYQVLDCLADTLEKKYDFIYAVSVVHMLVEDSDRDDFYRFLRSHLKDGGIGLICCQGDGEMEHSSDISNAFTLQDRVHEASGRALRLAGTSFRAVSFDTFREEMTRNGLEILETGLTDIRPDYFRIMYAVVKL